MKNFIALIFVIMIFSCGEKRNERKMSKIRLLGRCFACLFVRLYRNAYRTVTDEIQTAVLATVIILCSTI
jgi:hypothetical protein